MLESAKARAMSKTKSLNYEARKAELKLQENAIDAMSQANDETLTYPDEEAIDRPTVNRKKDDESE